jgi:hypothetical protein
MAPTLPIPGGPNRDDSVYKNNACMKETPRRRITVTSSLNEISTDQLRLYSKKNMVFETHGLINYTDTKAFVSFS